MRPLPPLLLPSPLTLGADVCSHADSLVTGSVAPQSQLSSSCGRGGRAGGDAVFMPRVSMPRVSMSRVSMSRVSLSRVSGGRIAVSGSRTSAGGDTVSSPRFSGGGDAVSMPGVSAWASSLSAGGGVSGCNVNLNKHAARTNCQQAEDCCRKSTYVGVLRGRWTGM